MRGWRGLRACGVRVALLIAVGIALWILLGSAAAGLEPGRVGTEAPWPRAPLLVRAAPPVADTLTPAALARADSLVAAWVDQGRIPGAVLLVIEDGWTRLERAYGAAEAWSYGEGQYGARGTAEPRGRLRPLEPPVPMDVGTAFDLASVTKVAATTFAVMALVDDGALDLDRPVAAVLPDFTDGGKERITPRQLLTHTAGLEPWTPVFYHAADADEAYAYLRDLPLAGAPGEERRYSDLGFMLLGRIVERVSGRPLDVFLEERLYGPLGLVRTGFRRAGAGDPPAFSVAATSHGNPYEHRMVHDTAFGYRIEGDPDAWDGWRRRTLRGEVNDGNAFHAFGGVAGHAGLFSTAAELGVLLRLLLEGGEIGGRRFFRPETIDAFLTPRLEGQALGWQVPAYAPPGSFTHTGFTGTWVLGVPRERLAVVLLTNRQNAGVDERTLYPNVAPLQRAVAEALLGIPPA